MQEGPSQRPWTRSASSPPSHRPGGRAWLLALAPPRALNPGLLGCDASGKHSVSKGPAHSRLTEPGNSPSVSLASPWLPPRGQGQGSEQHPTNGCPGELHCRGETGSQGVGCQAGKWDLKWGLQGMWVWGGWAAVPSHHEGPGEPCASFLTIPPRSGPISSLPHPPAPIPHSLPLCPSVRGPSCPHGWPVPEREEGSPRHVSSAVCPRRRPRLPRPLSPDTAASEQKPCLSKGCFLYFHNLAESTQIEYCKTRKEMAVTS